MKKTQRRGFTIVELVIVIAVIAILAAILIPTFSNIIKQANLSADKQAVREMNQALAEWEAEAGYPDRSKLKIEDAMQVLANRGYNNDDWVCLTDGYQVYWYDVDNRMILYNSSTAEVEYPEEYDSKLMLSAGVHLHIYNENHVKAQQFVMKLNSSNATVIDNGSAISSVTSSKTLDAQGQIISGTANSASNLAALANAEATIKGALGGNNSSALKLYATKEVISADTNKAYASMQISSVSVGNTAAEATPVLRDDGSYNENVYYLSVVGDKNAEGYGAAKQAAAQYIYNIFDQITTKKIDDDVVVIIAPGTELDCSTCEWAPCKTFTGYFGTTDASDPIVINGATISSKTGYSQTVQFSGSVAKDKNGNVIGNSKYFVTGFFGTVYGNTTIENVTFKNLSIAQPATDYSSFIPENRNTVAVIGAIINTGNVEIPSSTDNEKANVTLKNIIVEETCSITGVASAGGLVGYIGAIGNGPNLMADITIENCDVRCDVTSTHTNTQTKYHPVGGIIGFITRINSGVDSNAKPLFSLEIKGCKYSGTLTGPTGHGAVCGDLLGLAGEMIIDGGDYFAAKFVTSATTTSCCASLCEDSAGNGSNHMGFVTVKNLTSEQLNSDYAPFAYGDNSGTVLSYQIDKSTTWSK